MCRNCQKDGKINSTPQKGGDIRRKSERFIVYLSPRKKSRIFQKLLKKYLTLYSRRCII
nr:MAG TPA: hypothetical protein [Caudoviricetes sp.]DAV89469.1 MAG TPA: hypothetical protein [Caudoviricetes sp.]